MRQSVAAQPAGAAASRSLDYSHVAVVGDSTFDMQMASGAGCRAIGAAWGYGDPEALRSAGAHAIAGTPEALRSLL